MAQLSRKILGVSQQFSAGHDRRADTDVDKQQHKVPALAQFQLVQSHGIDIMLQIGGHSQSLGQELADLHPVPALKPGRV